MQVTKAFLATCYLLSAGPILLTEAAFGNSVQSQRHQKMLIGSSTVSFKESGLDQDISGLPIRRKSSSFPNLTFFPKSKKRDITRIGNLIVPSIGVGTISWSSESLTTLENLELQSLVNKAYLSDAALFDTAERYGSHLKTALGLGWGETETLLRKFLGRVPTNHNTSSDNDRLKPIVATKFTPSPWRTTVESVVEACEQSRERLGVEQIDLYQLHMPDVVKPFRFLGFGRPLDEVYWEGLAECYKRGLVKNVGVR